MLLEDAMDLAAFQVWKRSIPPRNKWVDEEDAATSLAAFANLL